MALGNSNISLRDIYIEINKDYPEPGYPVDLENLVMASNLSQAEPYDMGRFKGYSHPAEVFLPTVEVELLSSPTYHTTNNGVHYVGVSWRFYFSEPLASDMHIFYWEEHSNPADSIGDHFLASEGSTEEILSKIYYRKTYSYSVRMQVVPEQSENAPYETGEHYSDVVHIN